MVAEYPTPLVEALLAIIDAARTYLLPDGIGKGAFITKVLRVNVCDFYVFQGRPGFTVMAMTVNPDAGQSAPDTFRDEGLYVFRFDLNGDAREDISLKVRFGAVLHADDQDRTNAQSFEVRRASGPTASSGVDGGLIAAGHTGRVVETTTGVKAFAGLAPDLFAGRRHGLGRIPDRSV
jgi:hypothetical protein